MEGITATGTSTSTVSKPVKFSLSAFRTKSLLVFPAKSQHEFPGCRLGTDQVFIGFEVHGTILIPVPNRVQSPKFLIFDSRFPVLILVFRFRFSDSRFTIDDLRILVSDLCLLPLPWVSDFRFTIPDSRFTIYRFWFPIHDSRFTIHGFDSRFTDFGFRFPISDSRFPISDSRFPIHDLRILVSD